jgi:hypothetical protein
MPTAQDLAAFEAWKESQKTPVVVEPTISDLLISLIHSARFANESHVRSLIDVVHKFVAEYEALHTLVRELTTAADSGTEVSAE